MGNVSGTSLESQGLLEQNTTFISEELKQEISKNPEIAQFVTDCEALKAIYLLCKSSAVPLKDYSGIQNLLPEDFKSFELPALYKTCCKLFGESVANELLLCCDAGSVKEKGSYEEIKAERRRYLSKTLKLSFGTKKQPNKKPILRIPDEHVRLKFGEKEGSFYLRLKEFKLFTKYSVDTGTEATTSVEVELLFLPLQSQIDADTAELEDYLLIGSGMRFHDGVIAARSVIKPWSHPLNSFRLKWSNSQELVKLVSDIIKGNGIALPKISQILEEGLKRAASVRSNTELHETTIRVMPTLSFPLDAAQDGGTVLTCPSISLNFYSSKMSPLTTMQLSPVKNHPFELVNCVIWNNVGYNMSLKHSSRLYSFTLNLHEEAGDEYMVGRFEKCPSGWSQLARFCRLAFDQEPFPKYWHDAVSIHEYHFYKEIRVEAQAELNPGIQHFVDHCLNLSLNQHPFFQASDIQVATSIERWRIFRPADKITLRIGSLLHEFEVESDAWFNHSNKVMSIASYNCPLSSVISLPGQDRPNEVPLHKLFVPSYELKKIPQALQLFINHHTVASGTGYFTPSTGDAMITCALATQESSQCPDAAVILTVKGSSGEIAVSIVIENGYFGLSKQEYSFTMIPDVFRKRLSRMFGEVPTSFMDANVCTENSNVRL